MAVIELNPQPFFSNKNRAFWNLQTAGWIGFIVLRGATGLANDTEQPLEFFLYILISAVTGYSITLILSIIFGIVIDRRPLITWSITTLVLLLASFAYSYINIFSLQTLRPEFQASGFTQRFIGSFYLDSTLLAGWSALYYAINFFVRNQEQSNQLLRLEAQATSAQLNMLRYQLNPHFLFNTLNSISTLVLMKQTNQANAMLSRLSSFLRFTLINEAEAKVLLPQEIETLKSYLDIEKMRFEERLRVDFQISPRAEKAVVPSLILQPLVENAIKYAVTPKEDGADISVSASVTDDMLILKVADTGPGLNPKSSVQTVSTGVGMANTRERLFQAYGDDHSFSTYMRPQGGFEVIIEMPFQTAADEEALIASNEEMMVKI